MLISLNKKVVGYCIFTYYSDPKILHASKGFGDMLRREINASYLFSISGSEFLSDDV